jgi:tight adherence protein B
MASARRCYRPWASPETELDIRYLLAAIGLTVLLGAAYVSASRVERRRRSVRQRLATATGPSEAPSEPTTSLRRVVAGDRGWSLTLFSNEISAWLEAAFAATGGSIGLSTLLVTGLLAPLPVFVLGSIVMRLQPALVIILAVAAAVGAPVLVLRSAQGRFRTKFLAQFPDALYIIVRAVRSGLPVLEAMEIAARELPGPVGNEFQRTLDEMRIGVAMEEALQRTAERIRVPDFRFYAVSVALQRRTGGSLANTLTNLSGVIRARKELRQKAGALSAETKASVIVLSMLPVVVTLGLYLLNPAFVSVLFFDPRGRFMLGVAFLSLVAGIVVMVLMVKRSLR